MSLFDEEIIVCYRSSYSIASNKWICKNNFTSIDQINEDFKRSQNTIIFINYKILPKWLTKLKIEKALYPKIIIS